MRTFLFKMKKYESYFVFFILCSFNLFTLSVSLQLDNDTIANNINELYLQQLLSNMNTSADPCKDFYEYACGNWVSHYLSPEYLDMPGYMDHKVSKQLLSAIEMHKNESDGVYKQVWNYYTACVKVTAPALNAFLRLTQTELQFEWPILRENWPHAWLNATHFDWLRVIGTLRGYGLNGVFITQNVNTRVTNGSHYLIELHAHQAHLKLQQHDVEAIFVNFGLSAAASKNVTAKILTLEMQMLNVVGASDNETAAELALRNHTRLEMDVNDLEELVPQIAWRDYLESVVPRPLQVDNQTLLLYAYNLDYFRELPKLLQNYSNETISYYIMLKLMYHLNKELPLEKDNSLRCVQHLRGYMSMAMNYIYRQHFYQQHENATNAALFDIYNKLRTNFEKLVYENQLQLDAIERAYILAELHSMELRIGNLPPTSSQLGQFVDSYYQSIKLNASDFYYNHLQLIKFNILHEQRKLANTPTSEALHFYTQDPETASSSSPVKVFFNAILVPFGYLQLPFFHHQLLPLYQHSLFGFILAHEIIHAYDLFHIVYDQHGDYNELGIAVAHHFTPYFNCSTQSASNVVLSENMADISGLRLAYQTFFEHAKVDDAVGHSQFTSAQLFFINSVQFLCGNMAKIDETNVDAYDLGHDMHNVRVQYNWAQVEHFATAFQCAPASKMNPQQKCRLW